MPCVRDAPMLADLRSDRPERPFEMPLARVSKSFVKVPNFWPNIAVSRP
jgi:hypothetical protein